MNHYLKYCEACNEPMIANTGGYWCPNANCQGNRPVVTRNYSAPAPLADSPVPPSPVGETMEDGFYDWFESMAPPTANQMSRALWHKTIRAAWDAGCAWTNLAILERADPTLMQRKAGEAREWRILGSASGSNQFCVLDGPRFKPDERMTVREVTAQPPGGPNNTTKGES